MIIIKKHKKKDMTRLLKELGHKEAEIVKKYLTSLRAIIINSKIYKSGFNWHDLKYIVLVGLLLDMGVGFYIFREHIINPIPPVYIVNKEGEKVVNGNYYLWAIEGGTGSFIDFGVNLMNDLEGGVGRLWSHFVKTPKIALDLIERKIIYTIGKLMEEGVKPTLRNIHEELYCLNSIELFSRILQLNSLSLLKQSI